MEHFIKVDSIFSKLSRDLKDVDINESDTIEWIGEALEFLSSRKMYEPRVAIIEVKNHIATLPCHFRTILQVGKLNDYCTTPQKAAEEIQEITNCPVRVNSCDEIIDEYEVAYYRPFHDLSYYHFSSLERFENKFTLMRLAENKFFQSLVCTPQNTDLYNSCKHEYTLQSDNTMLTSFEEGFIALAYLSYAIDGETGYPLIYNNISVITAITYYVKWKIYEWHSFNRREGSGNLVQNYERLWNKYCKQAKNSMKMPKTLDEYINLAAQSYRLVPQFPTDVDYFSQQNNQQIPKFLR